MTNKSTPSHWLVYPKENLSELRRNCFSFKVVLSFHALRISSLGLAFHSCLGGELRTYHVTDIRWFRLLGKRDIPSMASTKLCRQLYSFY
jgi:hypothetical protein